MHWPSSKNDENQLFDFRHLLPAYATHLNLVLPPQSSDKNQDCYFRHFFTSRLQKSDENQNSDFHHFFTSWLQKSDENQDPDFRHFLTI